MKRIDIVYGGERYSVGGRDFEALRLEVETGLADGPRWLRVNDGEGELREAFLLLGPGMPVAIVPVPEGDDALGDGRWEDDGAPIEEDTR